LGYGVGNKILTKKYSWCFFIFKRVVNMLKIDEKN